MENPDLVLQETGSSPTHSRLNYVPSGDTLRRDAISSYSEIHVASLSNFCMFQDHVLNILVVVLHLPGQKIKNEIF